MKKIFMIMMLFLATVASYGKEVSNENSNNSVNELTIKTQTPEMYDFKNFNVLNFDDMSSLSIDQKCKVSYLMKDFKLQMSNSFNSKNRKKRTMRVINKNVKEMSYVLDSYQYRNYLKILNLEINKRGIDLM